MYGIYDMSGNAAEYVAAFNKVYNGALYGNEYYSEKGKMFATYNGTSTKYVTAYSNSTSSQYSDFTAGDVSHTGDAIREVWVNDNKAWFSDFSYYVYATGPIFYRGGDNKSNIWKYSGSFATSSGAGTGSGYGGYRIVLAK